MFNPLRLTLARHRRSFSSKELADKAGITSVTLSRIENGKNVPELETVKKVAAVLGFDEEFFYVEDCEAPSTDGISFRSLSAMTARERNASEAAAPLAYLIQGWVDKRFNLPVPNMLDLSSERNPVTAARALREHWNLGEQPISHMIKLLESKGVRIYSLSESTFNVDGYSCWRGDVPFVFLNTKKSAERSRFDCAHELGHLILHRHGGPKQGKQAELEAQQFAASFLMPEADVRSRIPFATSLDEVMRAKKRWGVAVSALAYRLHKLGIISDWQYRGMVIEIGKRGYRTREPNEMPREQSSIWKMVLDDLWQQKITKRTIANETHVPLFDIEALLFGIAGKTEDTPPLRVRKKPHLYVA